MSVDRGGPLSRPLRGDHISRINNKNSQENIYRSRRAFDLRFQLCRSLQTNLMMSRHMAVMKARGGGVLPYMGYKVCAAPKGMVFQPFWS